MREILGPSVAESGRPCQEEHLNSLQVAMSDLQNGTTFASNGLG